MHNPFNPIAASRCPHCGYQLNPLAWRDQDHRPETGDLTICQGCAHVLRFGKHLTLRELTQRDELALLAKNPDIKRQCAVVAHRLLDRLPIQLMNDS